MGRAFYRQIAANVENIFYIRELFSNVMTIERCFSQSVSNVVGFSSENYYKIWLIPMWYARRDRNWGRKYTNILIIMSSVEFREEIKGYIPPPLLGYKMQQLYMSIYLVIKSRSYINVGQALRKGTICWIEVGFYESG